MKVPQALRRRTDVIRLRNLRFRRVDHREIKHSNPALEQAQSLTITFEWQKKDARNDMVTQGVSGDPVLCGVVQGVALVRRIRSYPGANNDTPISRGAPTTTKNNIFIQN